MWILLAMMRKTIASPATLGGMDLVDHLPVNVPDPVRMGASRSVRPLLDLLLYTVLSAMLVDMVLEARRLPDALVTAALVDSL